MAGVCTGTMLWAHAGVITGRRANTHYTAHEELAELGVVVVPDRVVDDGDLVTAAASRVDSTSRCGWWRAN